MFNEEQPLPAARFEVVVAPRTVIKVAATVFVLRVVSGVAAAYTKNTLVPAMHRTLDKLEQAHKASLDDN